MKVKAFGLLRYVAGLGLALALFAVSPAIRVADPFGSALAADSPPAVAQPVPAANNPSSPGAPAPAGPTVPAGPQAPAMGADANAGSSDPLAYHRDSYVYASQRLRDPFGSLLRGRFVSEGGDKTPDIGSLDLVGVMWGDADKFALCEDREGHGYVLRIGDPVQNGEVAGITRESLTIRQYFFGTSTSVILKLKPREGNSNGKNRRR